MGGEVEEEGGKGGVLISLSPGSYTWRLTRANIQMKQQRQQWFRLYILAVSNKAAVQGSYSVTWGRLSAAKIYASYLWNVNNMDVPSATGPFD